MSYVSVLKNIPDFLSQPTGIAALASVGIHGAIAFILPLVPMESKPKETTSPKTVGLVELNQAEQNRLPQIGKPEINQEPQISLQAQVPLQSQVPPFPSFASKPTALPSTPAVVEPPLPALSVSSDNLNIVSLPKNQYVRIPQGRDLNLQSNLHTSNSVPSIPRVNYKEVASLQDKIALGESQPLPSHNEAARQLASNLPQLQAARLPKDLPQTPPAVPSDTTTTSTVPQTQEFVAPIGQTPQIGDKLALAGATLPQWQQQPTLKTPELSSTSTASQRTEQLLSKTTNFGEQFQKVKQQYPNIETKLPISETINAQKGQAGKIEGGLVVDSEGKVETIDFLDNSVSSDLKTATREFFREYFQKNPVQANGKPKYYPFSLAFNPNSSTTAEATSSKLPLLTPQTLPRLEIKKTQPLSNGQEDLKLRLRSPQENLQSPQPGQSVSRTSQPIPVKSSVELLGVRSNQPLPTTQEAAKPSAQLLRVRSNQPSSPAPAPQVTANPVSQQQISKNQLTSVGESNQKLLQKLRELRNERQSSSPEQ